MKNLKPPKYYSSILLNFQSFDRFLFRFADREEALNPDPEMLERIRDCMIYLICSRPIISIVPNSIQKLKDEIEFEIEYRINATVKKSNVIFPIGHLQEFDGEVKVSSFPHKSIHFYNKNGDLVLDLLVANMLHLSTGLPDEITNLEVLYVGKGTADCAIDRLDGHSTLEKILSDILRNEPNKEVAILIYKFKMKRQPIIVPSIGEQAEIRGKQANKRNSKIMSYDPTIDEQTKLTEAILIDYFKTDKYNTHFTKGLELHRKVFSNVQKVDFDAITVEINNENIGYLNIYSQAVSPKYFHNPILDFRKLEGRVTLFDLDNIKHST